MKNDIHNASLEISQKASRIFIAEEGRAAACYNTIIRDFSGMGKENDYSLKMSFELSDREAMQISRALKHIEYHMKSDVAGRFDVDLTGDANITAGLHALFKRSSDGSLNKDTSGSRPLVSNAMQNAIIEKLEGLVTTGIQARQNLDDDQNAAPSIPVYD